MRSIQGTAVTMGSVTPSLQEAVDRPYRHQNRGPGWPFDPATWDPDPDPGSASSAGVPFAESSPARRQRRIAEYQALMQAEPGLSFAEAARRMGLAPKTVRRYEQTLAEQRQSGEGGS